MSQRIKKIDVKGAYGEGNFGDDLLMVVLDDFFDTIHFPVNFVGRRADYPQKLLQHGTYHTHTKSEILIYGGGTQFFSFPPSNVSSAGFFFRQFRKIKRNLFNFISSIRKYIFPEPVQQVIFLGLGLGPFSDNSGTAAAKRNLSKALFVAVRDEVSLDYCKKWGFDALLGADIVFSRYFKNYLSDIHFERAVVDTSKKKKIALIIRDWRWDNQGNQYREPLFRVVSSLSNEFEFTFVVYAPAMDTGWVNALSDFNVICWDPLSSSIKDFICLQNQFDAFITARYHGAIIGCLLGKPVICVEVEDKLKVICSQIPPASIWNKPFEEKQLVGLIRSLDYAVDYSKSIDQQAHLADQMMEAFAHFMKSQRQ